MEEGEIDCLSDGEQAFPGSEGTDGMNFKTCGQGELKIQIACSWWDIHSWSPLNTSRVDYGKNMRG